MLGLEGEGALLDPVWPDARVVGEARKERGWRTIKWYAVVMQAVTDCAAERISASRIKYSVITEYHLVVHIWFMEYGVPRGKVAFPLSLVAGLEWPQATRRYPPASLLPPMPPKPASSDSSTTVTGRAATGARYTG